MVTPAQIEEFRSFAEALADAAAAAVLPLFRQQPEIDDKGRGAGRFDPVTEADRAAERVMRDMIAGRYRDHGIIGEEFGAERPDAEFVWYLDPIDGTRSFITGVPLWGILIGLVGHGRVLLGIMEQPVLSERFLGLPGRALYRRGGGDEKTLSTSACTRLAEARIATTDPELFAPGRQQQAFSALRAQARLTRYGGDCYFYCMVAAGHIDLVVEPDLKPFDIVPLIPVIEGAGGVVTDWDGQPATNGGSIIAAANAGLHALALELTAA